MKDCLRSNVHTDVPRQKLETVGNKSKNMKNYKRWMQRLFSSVYLSPSPSVLTDFYFFSTSTQKDIREEMVIVNIEDDGHVFFQIPCPLVTRYCCASCVFLVNISWRTSMNIRLFSFPTLCSVTVTDGFTLKHMKILNSLSTC